MTSTDSLYYRIVKPPRVPAPEVQKLEGGEWVRVDTVPSDVLFDFIKVEREYAVQEATGTGLYAP